MQILTTPCFPRTELPPSSDSKSASSHRPGMMFTSVSGRSSAERLFSPCDRYAVAESDCNLAIALDSNYYKAYARRGAARFALNKPESALEGSKQLTESF